MHRFSIFLRKLVIISGCLAGSPFTVYGQGLLQKPVSIEASNQPLKEVLSEIGIRGNFHFSYKTSQIPGDSLVSLSVRNQPVKQVLDQLFAHKMNYREADGYLILTPAPVEKYVYITGRLRDAETLSPVNYASVYSKNLLVSTLTGEDGLFKIRSREKLFPLELTISKVGYRDTLLLLSVPPRGEMEISLVPKAIQLDEVVISNTPAYRRFLSDLFVSTRLRMNNLNIGRFFVNFPYQVSLTPGIGTHGKMGSQVVNKFSLNLIGGYTAGTSGIEIAGGFNISTSDVGYLQIAGIFNLVSGDVRGVQAAGLHNGLQDSLRGLQIAGFSNHTSGPAKGVQAAGFYNRAGAVQGLQISGGYNRADTVRGGQMSGLYNRASYTGGFQAGLVNHAASLKGFQVGLVNIARHSDGYSLGILNFIKYGHAHLSLQANELTPLVLTWKTGTRKLYSGIALGKPVPVPQKQLTAGFLLGRQLLRRERWALATEVSQHWLLSEGMDAGDMPAIVRLHLPVSFRFAGQVAVTAGPALSYFYDPSSGEYTRPPFLVRHAGTGTGNSWWPGWQAGLSWFYGKSRL